MYCRPANATKHSGAWQGMDGPGFTALTFWSRGAGFAFPSALLCSAKEVNLSEGPDTPGIPGQLCTRAASVAGVYV